MSALTTIFLFATATQVQNLMWSSAPPLPEPRTNNAVASVSTSAGPAVFSFLGLDTTKAWDGIQPDAYRWDTGTPTWRAIAPVPGPGRLAATAQGIRGTIYLFGGYTVAPDGSEQSLPNVDIYDPATDTWSRGAPIPIPVDDAVSGVWRDSLIILVSGWHDRDNVAAVQVYDPATDGWRRATPIPGPPVFGHAGAIAGDLIVYLDGVRTSARRPRFSMEGSSWIGEINPLDPTTITWRRLPRHPGPPLYRAAAGALDHYVVFAGGTNTPYNYDGVGYNGAPAEPRKTVFAFDTVRRRWVETQPLPVATMDHRGIVRAGERLIITGGMLAGQQVTDRVVAAAIAPSLPR
jgi:N-acetylneuraminic acid mutarotase